MKLNFIILALFTVSFSFGQTEIAGVELPDSYTLNGSELSLNGAGVREKFWMDMYVGGLYTSENIKSSDEVITANAPMLIKLHIVSGLISSGKMSTAVEDGFENSTQGNTAAYRTKIDKFKSFFSEEISKNDVFDIAYSPSEGVVVFKNNTKLGVIEGLDFKIALFGIWFGEEPADKKLKKGMLNL